MPKQYQTVGLGGTFDHFHDGHKQFLEYAAKLSLRLHIGVTSPKLALQKQYASSVQPWDKRAHAVRKYCSAIGVQCTIEELHDIYGPTLTDERIQAIVVTSETLSGGYKINEARSKMGLKELPIHTSPMLLNEIGEPLHSEQIRGGTVNRKGVFYPKLFDVDYVLHDSHREFFQKPAGDLVTEPMRVTESVTAVVGDFCLENFVKNGWEWNIGVFDKRQQRKEFNSPHFVNLPTHFFTDNTPGTISKNMVAVLQQAISADNDQQTVLVDGEEDLATVALILLLPLDSLIYYGQPNQGMVEVVVTEQLKEKVFNVLL